MTLYDLFIEIFENMTMVFTHDMCRDIFLSKMLRFKFKRSTEKKKHWGIIVVYVDDGNSLESISV